jgi:hypothetical protein
MNINRMTAIFRYKSKPVYVKCHSHIDAILNSSSVKRVQTEPQSSYSPYPAFRAA